MTKKIAIVLAAGKGSRMKSDIPKPLHKIKGDTMLYIILSKLLLLDIEHILVVIGNSSNIHNKVLIELKDKKGLDITTLKKKISFVIQPKTLGTGHAVKCCLKRLSEFHDHKVLIMFADIPLISSNTLNSFISMKADCSLGVCVKKNPFGSGRIILDEGYVINSIEEKDCTQEQKLITHVNTGIYFLNSKLIIDYIEQIKNNNAQKEYYLPDLLLILINNKYKVEPVFIKNENEILNVNSQEDLSKAIKYYNKK